jgi:hypothetical protein
LEELDHAAATKTLEGGRLPVVESCVVESCVVESCVVGSCVVESCVVESCGVYTHLLNCHQSASLRSCGEVLGGELAGAERWLVSVLAAQWLAVGSHDG